MCVCACLVPRIKSVKPECECLGWRWNTVQLTLICIPLQGNSLTVTSSFFFFSHPPPPPPPPPFQTLALFGTMAASARWFVQLKVPRSAANKSGDLTLFIMMESLPARTAKPAHITHVRIHIKTEWKETSNNTGFC